MTDSRTGMRRRFAIALVIVATLAVLGPISAWAASTDESTNARAAATLVTRAHKAASLQDFSGRAVIGWTVDDAPQRAQVQVTESGGALEVVAGDHAAFDDGHHTYLHDSAGWTSILIGTSAADLPSPGAHWRLSTRPGRTIAGRPTTLVVASRPNGSPAQKMFLDNSTGLLLGREVLAANGTVERSVMFTSFEVGLPNSVEVPTDARGDGTRTMNHVPDGYRAPATPADGYRLVTRADHPGGALFFYSDGIFSASVFEQQGDLDWNALPAGGSNTAVDDHRVRQYAEPSGTVLVWEHDDLVYTAVTDAPSDELAAMVTGLSGSGRSGPESVMDYLLGPFNWG